MNDSTNLFDKFLLIVICVIIGFIAGIMTIYKYECNTRTPIDNNVSIDSLTTINDSIKIKVEHLDSIKNAKVIEVQTLDNDSTLKLFYELVSE